MSHKHHLPWAAAAVILQGFVASAPTHAQQWPSWGNDPGGMKYAALDQINRDNVKSLRIAWRRPAVADELKAQFPNLKGMTAQASTP